MLSPGLGTFISIIQQNYKKIKLLRFTFTALQTVDEVIKAIKSLASDKGKATHAYFGIKDINNYGLTTPQMRALAKQIGRNHKLALALWKTKIHEARHVAIFIADPKLVTEKLAEQWLKDFNAWDICDNTCQTVFDKTSFAWDKAVEWTSREKEFEKRAGFAMMAVLAVHDKKAADASFEKFFPYIIKESADERNFVRKAVNWALRQIGKRNERLCKKSIAVAKQIYRKGDATSRWIATDALRELEKYQKEGKIRNIGATR
jgi:3-methyladenine DNA glycosylase AlkD